MVAESHSPRRVLQRMGYSIIHDSTMEREATGGGRCRNLTRILRTECMFAIHSSLFDCWVWLFILCTFFKQNCGESAMSRKFLISMFIVVWRLEVGAWVGMGVSSRFFEIGYFKKMDGDLNFWTELSLISFFGKCNEANSIVSGILFSLLLGAGRLESAPSCVAMMVKAVVQGYLLPTPPTPSGHLNTNRDCKKTVRLYHSWWSYATFGMKLTNFHVAAMAEAVNRDISLPRQDKERPTPPTHQATLIPTEIVKKCSEMYTFWWSYAIFWLATYQFLHSPLTNLFLSPRILH